MIASIWNVNNIPYTAENLVMTSVAGQLMSTNLTKTVREEEGAAYSPHGYGRLTYTFEPELTVTASFGIDPSKKERVCELTAQALEGMAESVNEEDLNKIKEYLLKNIESSERENSYWLGAMQTYALHGVDKNSEYRKIVSGLTPAKIQEFVKKVKKQGNRVQFLMLPPAEK